MAKPDIKKNFIYSTLYQMLVIILPIITTPYVSRVLGAENIGIYSYSYSIAHYFMLMGMLGVKNYGNRCIASIRDDKEKLSRNFFNIYFLQLITTGCVLIVYIGYLILFVRKNLDIAIIQTLYLLTAAADISWFFFGLEEFKLTVMRNTLIKLVNVALVFVLVKTRSDLWKYTLIMSGGLFVGYVSLFPFLKRYVYWIRPTWSEMRQHIKPNLILFIPVIAVGIFNIMDKIMLGWLSNPTQVGYYENAEKMMRIPFGIITALGNVMMPRMTNLRAAGKKKEGRELIEISMCFTMFLACGMAFGLAGVAKVFAPLFFGEEFIASGDLLMALALTILFLSWANVVRTQYLIPNCMDREFTISTIIGAVVNVIINSLLISHMQAMGAVIGTILAEFSVMAYQTFTVRKALPIRKYLKMSCGFLVSGIIMFLLVSYIGQYIGSPIIALISQLCIGFAMYCLLCFGWMCLNRKNQAVQVIFQYINSTIRKVVNY